MAQHFIRRRSFMSSYSRVVDYIIEQADRYDGDNLQFEEDIKFNLSRLTDKYISLTLSKINTNITSVYIMQKILSSIEDVMNTYVSMCKMEMVNKFEQYYNRAYNNTGDLIDLGNEISAKFNQGISEQNGNQEYDEETISYIQQHAFELLKGHSWQKIEKIRAEMGNLFLQGKANKANVRSMVEKILNVNRSKAEEIAQTELSRAYNYGVMKRLYDYERLTGTKVKKYWHGFKYSDVTCEYCRPRIGMVYDLDDDAEELPAHVRCRCVWLPILDGWDSPVHTKIISRANMLNTAYSKDMMYNRIRSRLGINYAQYLDENVMSDYLSGDRTSKVYNKFNTARDQYIKDKMDSFNIARDNSKSHMSNEFNTQMKFWKEYVASNMADNNKDALRNAYEAIKGVMVLPWNASQLDKWNTLLKVIDEFK